MIDPPAAPIGFDALPTRLRARIEAELEPGEPLLWAAEAGSKPTAALPNPAIPGSIGLLATGLGLGLIGLGLRPSRWSSGEVGSGTAAFGLFLLLVAFGSWLVALSAWSGRRRNRRGDRRQVYALTHRRAVIWEPEDRAGGVEVISIEPKSVRSVHRLEYPDGSGEVRIGLAAENSEVGTGPPRALIGIAKVRRVESLIRGVLIPQTVRHESRSNPLRDNPTIDPFDPDTFEEPF